MSVLIAVGGGLLFLTGLVIGFITCSLFAVGKAADEPTDYTAMMRNEVKKTAARMGAVPEMMAPGENAEIVELDPLRAPTNGMEEFPSESYRHKAGCFGCRYAGRYLYNG